MLYATCRMNRRSPAGRGSQALRVAERRREPSETTPPCSRLLLRVSLVELECVERGAEGLLGLLEVVLAGRVGDEEHPVVRREHREADPPQLQGLARHRALVLED